MRVTHSHPALVLALLGLAACGSTPEAGAAPVASDTVLAVNGTELFVHREGTGDPVVVVHGGPLLDYGYLEAPFRPLAEEFELVYYDQRLSGRSAGQVDSSSVTLDTFVEDIEAVRRALDLGRIHLVGHSWGGLLAMKYAVTHGDHLRSLVLLSPMPPSASLWRDEQEAQAKALEPEDTAGLGALRSSKAVAEGDPEAIEELLRRSYRSQFRDTSLAESLDFEIPGDYQERSRQFSYLYPDLMGYDLREGLEEVEVPTLVIYGGDEVGQRIGRDALVAAVPHTTAVAIADAGHFPFLERPREFRRVLRAFLAGVDGREPPPAPVQPPPQDTLDAAWYRSEMVRRQIEARGIRDTAVLRAMRAVPREQFVPGADTEAAYSDRPLSIGHGQTISQPYIVAFMAQAASIRPDDRVLEIGTGSGYGAAVLAELAAEVYTIEIVPELAERARQTLARLGYDNVQVRAGNGWLGWSEHAPFDAIVVTAAPGHVPDALEEQLVMNGTLVIPVGDWLQMLRVLRKTPDGLQEVASLPVRFVPMVGEPPDTGR